ncbi:MAG: trpS [Candidatus Saccharibacteria bacterium]|nr:trpS [Candidatus Saccharibacteria bacterium]
MSKPVILTGIRANNDLTIGNYFGAILPIIDMAKTRSDEYQVNLFIPDLHSFTTPIDHSLLYDQILHNARLFVAAGLPLDNPDIYLYRQSYISAHSELTWILDCFTGFGEMSRMTQFKDKSQNVYDSLGAQDFELPDDVNDVKQKKVNQTVSMGLFNYPVLMAADILLYEAQYIPVGEDQTQHLEFARDISERFNNKLGDTFNVPESVAVQHKFFGKDQGLRIKDLIDPTKKMSKSDDSGRGVIFLGDQPSAAAKKVIGATTDDLASVHFDPQNQPGISNLLQILSLLQGRTLEEVSAEFEGQSSYGDFKAVVAAEVEKFLTDFQQKLSTVDDNAVIAKLEQSEHDLIPVANATLLRAQQAVGLRQKV